MGCKKPGNGTDPRAIRDNWWETAQPLCPQFRPLKGEVHYPVPGYCVLSRSPGWFMIPSIEEFTIHCTSAEFPLCCWFGAGDKISPDLVEHQPEHESERPSTAHYE